MKERSGAQSDLCSDFCVPGAPQVCRESFRLRPRVGSHRDHGEITSLPEKHGEGLSCGPVAKTP